MSLQHSFLGSRHQNHRTYTGRRGLYVSVPLYGWERFALWAKGVITAVKKQPAHERREIRWFRPNELGYDAAAIEEIKEGEN